MPMQDALLNTMKEQIILNDSALTAAFDAFHFHTERLSKAVESRDLPGIRTWIENLTFVQRYAEDLCKENHIYSELIRKGEGNEE